MWNSSYQILSYSVKHVYDVTHLLDSYARLLQKAIDIIWGNIKWVKKKQKNLYMVGDGDGRIWKPYYTERLIPMIPKSNAFKKSLRDILIKEWGSTRYAARYVDSAIKSAYSIMKSWRKNYLKGLRKRKKPVIKRRFVRVKETLYRFKDWKIVVTVKPDKLYLEFDLSRAWFKKRVEGCNLGGLYLRRAN